MRRVQLSFNPIQPFHCKYLSAQNHIRAMAITISINGPDNVGKTTQIGLLPRHYSILRVGGIHECDEKLQKLVNSNALKEWWWGSTDEEFVTTIFGALGRRYFNSMACEKAEIIIFDRGVEMFEAVAVATIAVKSQGRDLVKARAKLDSILNQKNLQLPREQVAILLKHGGNVAESVKITLQREDKPVDARYRLYQTLLQQELQRQENCGIYQHTIVAGLPESHIDVQDKIRAVCKSYTQHTAFQPVLHNLQRIYAFGGLSEAGKSTLAQSLCVQHMSEIAFRAKIAYFADLASEKLGKSLYDLSEKEQALWVLHEIEDFSNRHYWIRIITIESLHRDTMAMWLKTWLGDKLKIIFIDTADKNRLERSLVPRDMVVSKDKAKRKRGAHLIRSRADLILDNNGTFADCFRELLRFVQRDLASTTKVNETGGEL